MSRWTFRVPWTRTDRGTALVTVEASSAAEAESLALGQVRAAGRRPSDPQLIGRESTP